MADIVIAPFTISRKCRAARVIVDRRILKAKGAHALYIEGLSIRTETVAAARGRRPWAPESVIVAKRARPYAGQVDTESDEDDTALDRRLDGDTDE